MVIQDLERLNVKNHSISHWNALICYWKDKPFHFAHKQKFRAFAIFLVLELENQGSSRLNISSFLLTVSLTFSMKFISRSIFTWACWNFVYYNWRVWMFVGWGFWNTPLIHGILSKYSLFLYISGMFNPFICEVITMSSHISHGGLSSDWVSFCFFESGICVSIFFFLVGQQAVAAW